MNKPLQGHRVRNLGHTFIRLPPYHPELKSTELIWAQFQQSVLGPHWIMKQLRGHFSQ